MHAIICILEFMNCMLFLIKFIKFKQRIKLKKVRTSQLWLSQMAPRDALPQCIVQMWTLSVIN